MDYDNTETPIDLAHPERSNWIVVAAGFVLVLILYGAYYSFGVFLKPMLDDLGWSRAVTTGATSSTYLIVHGIFAIVMGHLSDKYGPRWVVMSGTILIALGYALTSQINAVWQLYVYFGVLVGIGMGAAYVPPLATVAKWYTFRRGLVLGVVAAGVGMGQIILPPFLKFLITEFGWRDSFVITGIMTCVFGLPAAMLLKNPPLTTNKDSENAIEPESDWSTRQAVRAAPFWLLLIIFAALVFGTNIVMQHLVAHIEDNGFDPIPAALVLTFIGVSGIFGRVISGGLADKIGSKMVAVICLAIQILAFFSLIQAGELWEFYIVGILYGLGYGGTLPLIIKMGAEFFGTTSGGAILGMLLFGASIGGAIGVPLAGHIHDVTDDYAIAFLIAGTVIIAASVINLILKPPQKKGSEPKNWHYSSD